MNNTLSLIKKIYLFKKYPKIGNNLIYDRFFSTRNKVPKFPRLLIIYITESCNLNCPFCLNAISRSAFSKNKPAFLSLEKMEKIAGEAKKYSPMIYLIGGEPLIHPQFKEIVKIVKKANLLVSTTTNGLLLPKYAKFIAKHFDFISVSLDYPEPFRHNQKRQKSDVYEKAMEGIKKLVKEKGKNILPNIKINTVIFDDNIEDLLSIYELAEKLKVDELSVQNPSFKNKEIGEMAKEYQKKYKEVGDIVEGTLLNQKNFLNQEEIKKLKEQLSLLKNLAKKGKVKLTILPKIDNLEKYYLGDFPSSLSYCLQPFSEINIRGNGDIALCQGIVLGNIKNKKIEEVWQSQKAENFRKHLKQKGIGPACYRCCALNFIFEKRD